MTDSSIPTGAAQLNRSFFKSLWHGGSRVASQKSPRGIPERRLLTGNSDEAAKYDAKHEKSLAQLTQAIQNKLDFIGSRWVKDEDDGSADSGPASVRLLDYACGTGLISRTLAPYTTQCVGIDISENMVLTFNARAENQGLSKEDMFAVVGDLGVASDPDPASLSGPEFHDFDVAAVGGGFHHFEKPELIASRLVQRLKPGGVLFIWDFLTHDVDHHIASHGVTHHGFSEDQVRKIFEAAGAGKNFALEEMGKGVVFGHEGEMKKRRAFLARGERGEL